MRWEYNMFNLIKYCEYEKFRLFRRFLRRSDCGAVIGLLLAPEKGEDTRTKITGTVEDFMKKHNIKLSRKEVSDLVDDIADVAPED